MHRPCGMAEISASQKEGESENSEQLVFSFNNFIVLGTVHRSPCEVSNRQTCGNTCMACPLMTACVMCHRPAVHTPRLISQPAPICRDVMVARCEDQLLANQSASSACDSILLSDGLGIIVVCLVAAGAIVELAAIFMMRKDLVVHDSLPMVMISVSAQVFNAVAILQLGANTETTCLLRPLVTNLSFTLACSSLVEHLVSSRLHVRGATNRKAIRNIFFALMVESVLQILWVTSDATPRLQPVSAYPSASLCCR